MPTPTRYVFQKRMSSSEAQRLLAHIDPGTITRNLDIGQKVVANCAIVFFDLCNFTNISWTLTSDTRMELLQELFSFVSKTVVKYKGMIDKYPGDGVVAFFPRVYSDPTDEIVEYSHDCVAEVMYWFYDKFRWHYHPLPRSSHRLELAAGIDAGFIDIAHVGSEHHSEIILLGDQVNCASKCQQAAAQREVVVGEGAANRVRNIYSTHFSTGPATGIVPAEANSHYLSYRFAWEAFLKTATWVDKDAR